MNKQKRIVKKENFMRKRDIQIATFGIACNLSLFLIKLYVGISSNSLAIYCDSVNNLGILFLLSLHFSVLFLL